MSGNLLRTYALPFGFRATFRWRDAHLDVEWEPRVPRIKKQRAWKKFFAAYKTARRDFYQDVSALIGGNILLVDTDFKKLHGMEVIAAPTRN